MMHKQTDLVVSRMDNRSKIKFQVPEGNFQVIIMNLIPFGIILVLNKATSHPYFLIVVDHKTIGQPDWLDQKMEPPQKSYKVQRTSWEYLDANPR